MAILTVSDLITYAPTVTLEGLALDGAIAVAQSYLESPMGANRPLEITEFTEVLPINYRMQNFYLTYRPILSSPTPPVIQARVGNAIDDYRRGIPVYDWQDLPSDSYLIDYEIGRINIAFDRLPFPFLQTTQGLSQARTTFTEVKVIYSSGWDFSVDPPSREVSLVKSVAGTILTYLSNPVYQGVKRLQVPFQEFEIEYYSAAQQKGAGIGEIPESLLYPIKRLAPVRF